MASKKKNKPYNIKCKKASKRAVAFLKHTEKLMELYPKTTTSKATGNPIYSEKKRKELSESINQNLHHIAKEVFGDKVNDPID